jgi:hypothetical protein
VSERRRAAGTGRFGVALGAPFPSGRPSYIIIVPHRNFFARTATAHVISLAKDHVAGIVQHRVLDSAGSWILTVVTENQAGAQV